MRRIPLLLLLGLVACSDEPRLETPDREVCLTRRDGARYCIEVYEASRSDATLTSVGVDEVKPPRSLEDRLPWTGITWEAARAQCEGKAKRLCNLDEWIDACDGVSGDGGNIYTYGETLDPTLCNTQGSSPEPGGQRARCMSPAGTFDQSGNVWEWAGNTLGAAAARGGGYPSSMVHRCVDTLPGVSPQATSDEIGFRCCRDG